MRWAPSICVKGPHSSDNPSPPSLYTGNQYSQGSRWGRTGEKVPNAALGVCYLCVFHVLCVFLTCVCACICITQVHTCRSCPFVTTWVQQHISRCPDCHIVTEVTCVQSRACSVILSLPLPITLLVVSPEAPYPYCHLLARHAYWLINKHG